MKRAYVFLGILVANLTDVEVAENFSLNLSRTWSWNPATYYLVPVRKWELGFSAYDLDLLTFLFLNNNN